MRKNKLSKNIGTAIKFKVKRRYKPVHKLNKPDCTIFYPNRRKDEK